MNPGFEQLQAYPFERLAEIRARADAPVALAPINMSIGEPQHATPAFIIEALANALSGVGKYPATRGSEDLREAIQNWLCQRFQISSANLDPMRQILPVNGTRESLFSIAQCLIDRDKPNAKVVMPNPFYQIYEGAALLAGAEPHYVDCPSTHGFLPDFDAVPDAVWRDCQLLYLCTPGNPSGMQMGPEQFAEVLELAERFDFTIVSDECYSELYRDEQQPPLGLLQVAAALGNTDFDRCIVMHSLSKRSNAPGLRSGFAAGNAKLMDAYLKYRTYHGCAMPVHVQAASAVAWRDENHVIENRRLYREKFDAVMPILAPLCDLPDPQAGFYLWPHIDTDDVAFCQRLIEAQNVITLPGRFLARTNKDVNPGANRLRIVLTDDLSSCIEGIERIATQLQRG